MLSRQIIQYYLEGYLQNILKLILHQNVAKITSPFYQLKNDRDYVVK